MFRRLKQLFNQVERSTVGVPAVHTTLERTSDQKSRREDWEKTEDATSAFEYIESNFHAHKGGLKPHRSIAFLQTESKKGFVLYLSDNVHHFAHPTFIMDTIRDRIKALGYVLYTSDEKIYSHNDDVESLQRHYLKPQLNFSEGQKLSQAYGNIAIEYIQRNDKPHLLKFSATIYKDHMFNEADGFEDLMAHICKAIE